MRVLRLGTRGSLLALAQSRLISQQLSALHPNLRIELRTFATPGDRDRHTPLHMVRNPDFFSADLDQALLDGTVDFCVHACKDLPAQRPTGIRCAALPTRENPRDVIVWRQDVMSRLQAGQPLRLGSSSTRRQENVRDFLATGLPATGHPARLDFVSVRGPVDARLARLTLAHDDPNALDGVILALAGLTRLWNDPVGRSLLAPLLKAPAGGARWMVLPLTQCPAAAGQGVLVIECRADDEQTHALLHALHDPATEALVAAEQLALADVAEADRAAFGATAIQHEVLGPVCHVRGRTSAGVIERLHWAQAPTRTRPSPAPVGFDGIEWQRACTRQTTGALPLLDALRPGAGVFAAYWHALEHHALPAHVRLWTSGVESWRQLAARGHWVEGCADHLGFDALRATLACPVLGLPSLQDWTVLTYRGAATTWHATGIGQVVGTYDIVPPHDIGVIDNLHNSARQATHCYWSSARQFHALRDVLPADAQHACAAGKTWHALQAAGVAPHPFPNRHEWQQWLGS